MLVLHDNGFQRDSCSNRVSIDTPSQVYFYGISQKTSFAYANETLVAWLVEGRKDVLFGFWLNMDYYARKHAQWW